MKKIIKKVFNYFRSEQWHAIEKMIDKIVMATTPIFLIVAYLIIAFASSFKLKNYPNFFVYVSFFMSLLLLVISIIPYSKRFAQRYRGASMVVVLGLSFCYASLRVAYMSFMPQIEDMGTGVLLLMSFCVLLNERNKKDSIMKNKREIDVLQIVTDRNKNRIRKPLPIVYNYILTLFTYTT